MGEQRACFRVWPRPDSFAGIVQKQCQIQNKWILQLLKNFAISYQLRIIGRDQRVQFVDADQRVFVGRITMQELMLHQTGQLAEFGNISAEEIDPMHHSKNAANFAFLGQYRFKYIAGTSGILKCPSHLAETSTEQVCQFRT